ncbi:rhodanese-like domain-containing protein [Sulfurimonas lithotrophica]|uniref:Rhodanese-like domain-containing protein n=1 Tax=Sulfurimonas lithotrophica TaxID=2590022 RepID=A0A5P8P1C5_9BACT|nr:rhodanese-like domain-containing protein [Sulfurimonas lithotrophica]QFR49430.1 rhodanese-like domain-containing protein [Sulfurimonas lithotrophica]
MNKLLFLIGVLVYYPYTIFAQDVSYMQFDGLEVTHTYNSKSKDIEIKREIAPECLNLKIVQDTVFGGDYANKNVPKRCKKTFVTTLGSVQPLEIKGIKTIGELELLEFLEKASYEPKKYVLVDARKVEWYEDATIPSAVNIPYTEVKYDKDLPEDFNKLLKTFNIKVIGDVKDAKFDFSKAKTAVIFCNGSWCKQSSIAIEELLNMGYPKEKLMWYRGGMQEWYILDFTTIRGKLD